MWMYVLVYIHIMHKQTAMSIGVHYIKYNSSDDEIKRAGQTQVKLEQGFKQKLVITLNAWTK